MERRNVIIGIGIAILPFICAVILLVVFLLGPNLPGAPKPNIAQPTASAPIYIPRTAVVENSTSNLFLTIFCLSPFLAINGILAIILLNDATKGNNPYKNLWGIATFLGGLLVLIVYFILKPKK